VVCWWLNNYTLVLLQASYLSDAFGGLVYGLWLAFNQDSLIVLISRRDLDAYIALLGDFPDVLAARSNHKPMLVFGHHHADACSGATRVVFLLPESDRERLENKQ